VHSTGALDVARQAAGAEAARAVARCEQLPAGAACQLFDRIGVPAVKRSVADCPRQRPSGCSSAWVERYVRDVEAGGSNPLTPDQTQGDRPSRLSRRAAHARPPSPTSCYLHWPCVRPRSELATRVHRGHLPGRPYRLTLSHPPSHGHRQKFQRHATASALPVGGQGPQWQSDCAETPGRPG